MNALWLENNAISLREVPLPQTTNTVTNEALIKIRKAGFAVPILNWSRDIIPTRAFSDMSSSVKSSKLTMPHGSVNV
jgi:hypothetical protein